MEKKQKFEAIKFAAVNDWPLKFVELFWKMVAQELKLMASPRAVMI